MAKRIIRTGTTADPTGDSLKNAFTKVNDNFTELYNALGLDADALNIGAFEFSGSVMSTTDSSAITIDQAVTVTSDLTVGGDVVPQTALGGNLGSAAKPWSSLYVSNNTIYIGGTAVGVDNTGKLTVGGNALALNEADVETATDWSVTVDDKVWTFDNFGAITLPGGNTITTSSGLDLSPASGGTLTIGTGQYSWRFDDNDGSLTFPSGVRIESDVAGNTNIWGASNKYIQLRAAGADGPVLEPLGGILINSDGTTEIIAQTLSDSAAWIFNANDSLTFPDSTVQTTAYTGTANIARNIESESDVSIKVNLSDSTQHIWRFGEDGDLTLPRDINLSTGGVSGPAFGITIPNSLTGIAETFLFDTEQLGTGAIFFPNGTQQITAWDGIPGPYADDVAAAAAGVLVGYPYHKTGTSGQVFVRLT